MPVSWTLINTVKRARDQDSNSGTTHTHAVLRLHKTDSRTDCIDQSANCSRRHWITRTVKTTSSFPTRMAPDINSMPSSPRQYRQQLSPQTTSSNSASRRASREMPPPPIPLPSSGHQPPVQRSPALSNNEFPGEPLRHPRPLTAAELYAECEKEQEAVVSRVSVRLLSQL